MLLSGRLLVGINRRPCGAEIAVNDPDCLLPRQPLVDPLLQRNYICIFKKLNFRHLWLFYELHQILVPNKCREPVLNKELHKNGEVEQLWLIAMALAFSAFANCQLMCVFGIINSAPNRSSSKKQLPTKYWAVSCGLMQPFLSISVRVRTNYRKDRSFVWQKIKRLTIFGLLSPDY